MSNVLLIVGVLIVIISILGCGTAKLKHPMMAIPFGLLIFIVALIMLIIGMISIGGSTNLKGEMKEMFKKGCD
jgi:protein-S-isoprenylcysteine O-methyltransferase Ste14